MISFLRGKVMEKLTDTLILDVQGVGYEVRVTGRLWQKAVGGKELELCTHFHVREDAQVLFGFGDLSERDFFRKLLTVNGVGPKTAMNILSALTVDDIVRAIRMEDAARLKVPGLGPKTIKRLLLELKNQLNDLPVSAGFPAGTSRGEPSAYQDALTALEQLGYTPQEVRPILDESSNQEASTADLVRLVLSKVRK